MTQEKQYLLQKQYEAEQQLSDLVNQLRDTPLMTNEQAAEYRRLVDLLADLKLELNTL